MNSIISSRNPAPPAGFAIIKNVQKRKKRVSVNRNTLLSSYNKCKKHSRIHVGTYTLDVQVENQNPNYRYNLDPGNNRKH